jgi:dienelactone hydrolase
LESLSGRWAKLAPHVKVYGPDDASARPAVLLFHGCGGVRGHTHEHAEAAAEAGFRAFVIDSYGARGWNRLYGLMFVCTGLTFRGVDRTGDVLAAIWGVSQRSDVDPSRLALAGWSHGSWTIMDLMTMRLARAGEAGLVDAPLASLEGVRSLYLAYPYGGVGALTRTRPWVRTPRTYGIVAEHDHVTRLSDAEKLFRAVERSGAELEVWRVRASHAFDENQNAAPPMKYDPELAAEALQRFRSLLTDTLGEPATKRKRRKT